MCICNLTNEFVEQKRPSELKINHKYSMAQLTITILPPKSVLHYWLSLSKEPTQDFIRLLDYLSERDLGLLEIALSERDMRPLYMQVLKNYYETHEILISKLKYSQSHFDWILNRGLNNHIQKLAISNKSIEINFYEYNIKLPSLLEVRCWYITPQICLTLGLYSPNLQSLRIYTYSRGITEKSIENICAGCRMLKCIQICSPGSEFFTRPISRSLFVISNCCKELEVLKLYNWNHIDSIACLSELTNLRELGLDMVRSWSSTTNAIFASNTKLETVRICGDLSHDLIMRALGAHCHSLKHVRLGSPAWEEITDEDITAMVQGCPLLETINIAAWKSSSSVFFGGGFVPTVSVTNSAMYAIAHHCIHLKLFKINSPDSLAYDNTGLDAIKCGCPDLQAIYEDDTVYYAAPGYDTTDDSYNAYYRENGYF